MSVANAVLDLIGSPSLVALAGKSLTLGTSSTGDLIFLANGTEVARFASGGAITFANGTITASTITTLTSTTINAATVNVTTALTKPLATGITAAGTDSATGTLLTKEISNVTTVGASTGVRLYVAPTGSILYVKNSGANALLVYPDTGGTINGGSTDAGVSVATGAIATLIKVAALTWIASEAPAA